MLVEPLCPHIIYQKGSCLKTHYKFYKDISIKKGLSSKDISFPIVVEMQLETESDTENISP